MGEGYTSFRHILLQAFVTGVSIIELGRFLKMLKSSNILDNEIILRWALMRNSMVYFVMVFYYVQRFSYVF